MRQLLIGFSLLALSALAIAQSSPIVHTIEAFIVTDGGLVPATTARPFQTVHYRLTVRNQSESALPGGVVVTAPVPFGTEYVAGSATRTDEARAEYGLLTGVSVPALEMPRPESVGSIRWTFLNPFPPGAVKVLEYRVVVVDPGARPETSTIEYRVHPPPGCVAFVTVSGRGGVTEQFSAVDAAWRYRFEAPSGQFLFLSAQNSCDRGVIVVEIYVDGRLYKSARSEGAFVIATASGVLE